MVLCKRNQITNSLSVKATKEGRVQVLFPLCGQKAKHHCSSKQGIITKTFNQIVTLLFYTNKSQQLINKLTFSLHYLLNFDHKTNKENTSNFIFLHYGELAI